MCLHTHTTNNTETGHEFERAVLYVMHRKGERKEKGWKNKVSNVYISKDKQNSVSSCTVSLNLRQKTN